MLFPECATTGYGYDFSRLCPTDIRASLQAVSRLAAAHRIHLLVGSPVFKGRRLFHCLVVFDRQGKPVRCYATCQLTAADRRCFSPGDQVSLFALDGVPATAIICHERRYPELVRLACMAGARILFHPNAGLDAVAVSRKKRNGRDGMAIRAFENGIYYVFANSVGPQGGGKWSAGDAKIVAPDMIVSRLADNQNQSVITANLDLANATGQYARDSLEHPKSLRAAWKQLVTDLRKAARTSIHGFDLPARPA